MIIDCISDLHGAKPKLEGGDLLIVAGDLTAADKYDQYVEFFDWLKQQDYLKKVFISGNHDNQAMSQFDWGDDTDYLYDSGTEFEWCETHVTKWGTRPVEGGRRIKVKIWGSPWTTKFEGMNPRCMAFTVDTDRELADKWVFIPEDVDILVTHSPPYGILDEAMRTHNYQHTGSMNLTAKVHKIRPKLHVFGHIHEAYGRVDIRKDEVYDFPITYVNASIMDVNYRPSNKPIRIEL